MQWLKHSEAFPDSAYGRNHWTVIGNKSNYELKNTRYWRAVSNKIDLDHIEVEISRTF